MDEGIRNTDTPGHFLSALPFFEKSTRKFPGATCGRMTSRCVLLVPVMNGHRCEVHNQSGKFEDVTIFLEQAEEMRCLCMNHR